MGAYEFQWRGDFTNAELNRLHAEAFDYQMSDDDWAQQVKRYSLGWVTARDGIELVGFVNVPWDGGFHAFILDTIVAASAQRRGIGTRLVELAAAEARAAGCGFLHVDFKDDLRSFYFDSCGFRPTTAGLLRLAPAGDDAD
jgi:ribosomal protein S18 acetylase RimI-like enzyme